MPSDFRWNLKISVAWLTCCLLLSQAALHAQDNPAAGAPPASPLSTIPRDAISKAKSFVLARDGEALFYNLDAGIVAAPFLSNVYKSFGFSHDSRYFLYLKADGRRPTFALYLYDLDSRTEERITDASVHHAEWSPAAPRLAYLELDGSNQLHLSIYDLVSKKSTRVASGSMRGDFLQWSPDGSELLYLTVSPRSGRPAEDRKYAYALHRYADASGGEIVVPEITWANVTGRGVAAGGPQAAGRLAGGGNANETVRGFAVRGRSVYVEVLDAGREVVKRWNEATGSVDLAEEGTIYASTDQGVVIRSFAKPGVAYKYLADGARGATELLAASTNWRLPFGGYAYMVQGGTSYSGGACDGATCMITAHGGPLGYALDWQQIPAVNQGNTHILAVEGGTVAAVYSTVTCNSVTTSCHVGEDDYSSPCNDPNGGAGNFVSIAHIDGSYSFYAHLRSGSVRVAPNQAVNQGEYLADQGHSGSAGTYNNYRSCGDHLHFSRQTGPLVWDPSVPTDFTETPCLLGCPSAYQSANVEIAGAPVLGSVSPNSGAAGTSVPITLTGTNFVYGATVGVSGTGITISNVQLVSGTSITATLQLAASAAGTYSLTVTTPNGTSPPLPFTVVASIPVTLISQPAGLTLTADGVPCTSPCAVHWIPGTTHSVAAPASAPGGTGVQYLWASWSDGGALAHSVVAPSAPATYTAVFNTQYFLTTQ
ncbi:MAG: peptidoglycan DD-metalloendopeptidase family protein, partial [Bryobacterales bacterium]|nr:peptidoglycan DD-metalloendopeptidase family protein [Bryobacterales bacterium]